MQVTLRKVTFIVYVKIKVIEVGFFNLNNYFVSYYRPILFEISVPQ